MSNVKQQAVSRSVKVPWELMRKYQYKVCDAFTSRTQFLQETNITSMWKQIRLNRTRDKWAER